jgi:hypothetical protein
MAKVPKVIRQSPRQTTPGLPARGMEKQAPDDEGWSGEIIARYERGVMLFLFILAATVVSLIIWLGAYLLSL